jgi:glucose/arabinose dehydrogenase
MRFLIHVIFFFLLVFMTAGYSQVEIQSAFPNLTFSRPVDLQYAGDGSNRLFVVEQQGIIRVFENNPNVSNSSIFLDIIGRVLDSGNEQGLLGLAFHPDYVNNGYFYVNYTATSPNRTVISRFKVSEQDSNIAIADSELVLLEFNQPYSNHNGGQIAFGPNDGYLYIGTGDGGSYGDPECNAQNRTTLLGAILRIDVNGTSSLGNYSIPADNPFYNNSQGFREEIYAYGLRNPWRFSFDPLTGWLWAADVGQGLWEEVDLIVNGGNYGWSIFEGNHCYNSTWPCDSLPCDTTGLKMPIWEYNHNVGQSITGGYVYRGSLVSELVGKYVYADFVSGRIWTLEYSGSGSAVNQELFDTSLQIASFGKDPAGELYICAFDGKIYHFVSTTTSVKKNNNQGIKEYYLAQNYPNPFNPETHIAYKIVNRAQVKINIMDLQGRLIRRLVNQIEAPGIYNIVWDGTNQTGIPQSSGIYFYQLLLDGKNIDTKRMLLLR